MLLCSQTVLLPLASPLPNHFSRSGRHIDSALSGVPVDQRCKCKPSTQVCQLIMSLQRLAPPLPLLFWQAASALPQEEFDKSEASKGGCAAS
jgi:hypothetical protein